MRILCFIIECEQQQKKYIRQKLKIPQKSLNMRTTVTKLYFYTLITATQANIRLPVSCVRAHYLEKKGKLCPDSFSSSKHFLDHVSRHIVEEEGQDGQQQERRDDLYGQPPVLVAHQVLCCLEWDEEPEEGDIWAAVRAQREEQQV